MTAVGSQEPDDLLPHSCHHCKGFVVHLFDGPGEGRTDTPIWHSPNPSQERLATNLYGDDFWTAEWAEYREYFFRRTNGISFLIVCKEDLKRFSADGCLLSRRFAQSLRDDELPRKYAIGMQMPTAYSIELRALDLEGMTSEMLLGGDDDEDPDNVYTVMANRGSAVAEIIDSHPINPYPGSDDTLARAREWLQDCMQNHSACTKPDANFTPTRLIRIDFRDGELRCQLTDMSTAYSTPYAALSYCWGGDQDFKTTRETLPQYLNRIDISQLPQTLQDAILVAARLGLHYIWIDALCIIQDSAADKAVEINRMASVYGNATITIAATRASAVWNGFLSARPSLVAPTSGKFFSFPCERQGQGVGAVTLLPFTHESTDPLDTRGWTFQERVLSPRVLDFGTLRTQYTCQTALGQVPSDGWSNLPMERAYGSGLDAQMISDLLAGLYTPEEMLQQWLKVVEGFTSRGLSFATDRLPAIAGIAQRFGELMKEDQFCAGLWRRSMPASLLWKTGNRMQHINHDFERRLSGNVVAAPSWSWAAVSRAVAFDPLYTQHNEQINFTVKVKHCTVIPLDERVPYGGVKEGVLRLETWARQAKWAKDNIYNDPEMLLVADAETERPSGSLLKGYRASDSTGIHFVPDAMEIEFLGDSKKPLDVRLLLFGTHQPAHETGLHCSIFGLVVRRCKDDETRFSRVGVFQKALRYEDFVEYLAWFQQTERGTFVIM